jgi:hypothetical protein
MYIIIKLLVSVTVIVTGGDTLFDHSSMELIEVSNLKLKSLNLRRCILSCIPVAAYSVVRHHDDVSA